MALPVAEKGWSRRLITQQQEIFEAIGNQAIDVLQMKILRIQKQATGLDSEASCGI